MDSQQNHDFMFKFTCIISSLLKKWKVLFLVMLIFGVSFDVLKTITYVPQYSSSMTAILKLEENTYMQLENARAYIKTLDYIFNGQVVKNYVKEKLNSDDLKMKCYITSVNDTNVVNIKVVSQTKKEAFYGLKHIVNWYQNNTDQYHFSYELDILEEASLNEYPININNHMNNFGKGFIISGLLSVSLLGVIYYLKDNIKMPNDIKYKVDCRLYAKIPKELKKRGKKFWKRKKEAVLITSLKTSFQYKESIKKLRTKIEESSKKHQYHSIMITSTIENEGKSSIAVNLALSLSKNDYKVLLIDADIRKPSAHKIFQMKTERSLNQYLTGNHSWESQVQYLEKYDLFVMFATQDLNQAEKLLGSEKMKQFINEASQEFDFVIVDTSPCFGLNEPIMINEFVDASLLVVKQNDATVHMINETISRLVNAKNNLIGCIYNANVIDLMKEQKVYGYRYGYNRYKRNERGA